jgi:phage gp46-like protein
MSFGAYLCGIGLAGFAPIIPPNAPRRVSPPAALLFDGSSRDFPLDENGFYQESHPVDQEVSLALCISRGAIASASGVGNKLRTISRVSQSVAEALARAYIRDALASLVSRKAIEVQNVTIDTTVPGRLLYAVTYLNLETARITGNKAANVNGELAYA